MTRARRRGVRPRTVRVLPMEVRIGDRFTDADGEWSVVTRPAVFHEGHLLSATVRRVDRPGVEKSVRWPAHEKLRVRRGAAARPEPRVAARARRP